MPAQEPKRERTPSQRPATDGKDPNDWHVEMLARIRKLILQADPEVVEEVDGGGPISN